MSSQVTPSTLQTMSQEDLVVASWDTEACAFFFFFFPLLSPRIPCLVEEDNFKKPLPLGIKDEKQVGYLWVLIYFSKN